MAETSVIIPVLNGEDHLRAAVDSVLAQLAADDEVLVIDDGSTDRTLALMAGCDPRLRVLTGPGRGPSAARNLGIAQATGSLLAFLDHDDLWPEGRHAALRESMLAHPASDAAVGRLRLRVDSDAGAAAGPRYAAWDGSFAPSMIGSCLYRRALLSRVGGFNEALKRGEDSEFLARLIGAGALFHRVDHDALVYRRHAGNLTHAAIDFSAFALQLVRARRGR
jgi:glycosyltransferase involved in cell wall biosynthesis